MDRFCAKDDHPFSGHAAAFDYIGLTQLHAESCKQFLLAQSLIDMAARAAHVHTSQNQHPN